MIPQDLYKSHTPETGGTAPYTPLSHNSRELICNISVQQHPCVLCNDGSEHSHTASVCSSFISSNQYGNMEWKMRVSFADCSCFLKAKKRKNVEKLNIKSFDCPKGPGFHLSRGEKSTEIRHRKDLVCITDAYLDFFFS